MTTQRPLVVERVGRIAYAPMLAIQEQRHASVLADESPDTLYILEHEPVVTLGKNSGIAGKDYLRRTPEQYAELGIDLVRVSRGGDVTYHGPGQIVGYPIVKLGAHEKDIRKLVWNLEQAMIDVCFDYGLTAHRDEKARGVYIGNDKIAAIGLKVSRWTTMHGFAFNVATNLGHFDTIVACGLENRGVTSLERLLNRTISLHEVEEKLIAHVAERLGRVVNLWRA
ncbi:MAG: lipoyl(octanoyl) transferase LipB [Clostridia bacterium]|nr:lipoyl(octanoyl) transferase LipB [Deltaproteobacteria bacterium]